MISVNPYKALNLYGPGVLREYKNAPIGTKDPHIFAIADEAFRGMLKDRQNQCAIIRYNFYQIMNLWRGFNFMD